MQSTQHSHLKSIVSTLAYFIAIPVLAILLTAYVLQSYQVSGQSMESTLSNKNRLFILKVPRTIASITHHSYIPDRGDIVVFRQTGMLHYGGAKDSEQLIKRVIGLPGDHVIVQDGHITIYNQQHPDGYNPDVSSEWAQTMRQPVTRNVDITVAAGQLFVCGDNRPNSIDSRSFGTISANQIVGKLLFRVTPLNQAELF